MVDQLGNNQADVVRYPWYEIVAQDDLEQGDIFEACPVFSITLPFTYEDFRATNYEARFRSSERDVIVMTQSCDLVKDHPKVKEVILCPVWDLQAFSEKNEYLRHMKGREEIRQGKHPGLHMLNVCHLPDFERQIRLVDFHRVFSLPLDFMRGLAASCGPRLRLLPPYREHLGQAFARYFMRVGLPVDIPPFKAHS
jgi:hypothetical protein